MAKLRESDREQPVTGQDKSIGITDLPFVDLLITHSALMLPVIPTAHKMIRQNGEIKFRPVWPSGILSSLVK